MTGADDYAIAYRQGWAARDELSLHHVAELLIWRGESDPARARARASEVVAEYEARCLAASGRPAPPTALLDSVTGLRDWALRGAAICDERGQASQARILRRVAERCDEALETHGGAR